MKTNHKKLLLNLIDKLLDGSITRQERGSLLHFFINNQKISDWPQEFPSKEHVEKNIFDKIQLELKGTKKKKTSKKIFFFKRKVFKYGVAASLLILVSIMFFVKRNTELNNDIEAPVIVNNDIEIGTDKATLTLEDGTTIALEKGQQYITDNLRSDGEALIYKNQTSENSKILYNYLTIPRGGQFHVVLSDGTEVWLNSASQIKYPKLFKAGEARQVELVYGEAYFDVSPSKKHQGSTFEVISKGQKIEVLGTKFNVKAYQDELFTYTTLVEGKVSLNTLKNKTVLKPKDQHVLHIITNKVTINQVDVYYETAWIKGLFAFKNKSLKDIMTVLSRWYDIDVVFEDKKLETIEFKGVISKNQNIEEILLLIKNIHFINAYEINKNTIIIK